MKAQVIGKGMIAQAMQDMPYDAIIFAAGESNSMCQSTAAFAKEKRLIKQTLNHKLFVYFSTITTHQTHKTPYILHKINMEKLISKHKHLILKLPNIVGPNQSDFQLIPSLIKQIKTGKITIQKGAVRDIIDAEDLRTIVDKFINENKQGTHNVLTGRYISVKHIVTHISNILNIKPEIQYIPKQEYPLLKSKKRYDKNYHLKILRKNIHETYKSIKNKSS